MWFQARSLAGNHQQQWGFEAGQPAVGLFAEVDQRCMLLWLLDLGVVSRGSGFLVIFCSFVQLYDIWLWGVCILWL